MKFFWAEARYQFGQWVIPVSIAAGIVIILVSLWHDIESYWLWIGCGLTATGIILPFAFGYGVGQISDEDGNSDVDGSDGGCGGE